MSNLILTMILASESEWILYSECEWRINFAACKRAKPSSLEMIAFVAFNTKWTMPIYQLPEEEIWFPDKAEFDGDIVAVGGDLSRERLLAAYSQGIFPWYNDPGEIVWWCPVDRCILHLDKIKISRSMRNVLNQRLYRVTMDTDFRGVIEGCRSGIREHATWLLDEMADAYEDLYNQGLAHSVEVWEGKELVGGLYGLSLGKMFYGESMFAKASNSSKVGFIMLVHHLKEKGFKMIDCQVYNDHLGSLGAETMHRDAFLEELTNTLNEPTRLGKWTHDFAESRRTFRVTTNNAK